MSTAPELVDLLAERRGLVCAVGAGGKKSVLRAIAAAHPGRVALTGTVPFVPHPEAPDARRCSAELDALAAELAACTGPGTVIYGRPEQKKGRWGGVPPEVITDWHERFGFDATLVKADGARMRWVKAPAADEPVLTPACATLIPVQSPRALGEPLSERTAHRAPLVAELTGCGSGEAFQPEHAARLLASEHGLLKSAGRARVCPVINMVDDEERRALALATARRALQLTDRFDQVLLLCLKKDPKVVAVVRRGDAAA